MATLQKSYISQIEAESPASESDAAAQMAAILEEHFDAMGWDEEERTLRVSNASKRIISFERNAKSPVS